ncbi:TRAP transporter substrate-binding protein [Roseivivax sediminis]|uniref:TRAP-type C4-dicarboxylate transport system, substrate-binding protein n=1 Tax=Roseivivax sediminis TaxID=936889 RepID=A0A1I1U7Q7_9RHOB|nr:TRAP transporter substrate-binding protein [Roseivivax sediminis]SFD64753.1 TRAP-type C4-dicarboxylate transport system, substrate-binding protein [Roseivivax sediminis]
MTLDRRTLVGAALTLGLIGTAASAQEVTLRMHQFLPLQANVPQHILEVWKDRIEEQSDGRIAVQHYPSMQLGGTPPQLVDQVIDGVADVIWTVAGYTPGRFPRVEVFELPFTVTDAEPASKAFWELAQETMIDEDFSDFKLLATWVHGPGVIHSSEPIETVDDLNGVKLRAPTRTTNMMLERLGATPVGMPVPAIPEALSKGVVDGAVIPWEVTGALRVPELVQNHTEFGPEMLYTTAFIFAMNQNTYDSLPDDLKKVIDDNSGMEFSAFAGKTQQDYDAPAREEAVAAGNNIITLSEEQVAEWQEAAEPTIEAWIEEMDERDLDGQGLYDRAVELIEKHSAE